VPIGVTGELYIGGDVLALGYLDRAELTEERFVDDPFSGTSGARMYKTGDLSRFLPDGNIEFLGRNDHQVKIRGYRVEPDEVETTLSRVDSVREAFVVVQGDTNVDRRLAAYIVADEGHELVIDEIVSALKVELPEFMVPGVFFQIDAPPLTPSGKVDRANLARCESARVLGGAEETVEPQGDVECNLRDIWQEVIAVEPIGVRDNFFDLGGHSILAVRVMARVKKSFGVDVPLATLFKAPTIEELAALIQQELDGPADDAAGPVLGERSWTCLVELQKGMPGSSKTPLFCVHGVGGNILRFSALVRRLGGARPCYGLQAKGVDGKQQPHECLREMAEFYVSELRDAQPKGPYMICGYSSGG
jgi:acyl carrier protein